MDRLSLRPLTLELSLKKYFTKTADELSIDPGFEIQQRSIVPLNEYVTRAQQSQFQRWNVVLLMVESLRADQLRAYGGSQDVMPAVEALAQDARVFLNTYTQSSHTNYATITPLSAHYPLRSATAYTYPKNPGFDLRLAQGFGIPHGDLFFIQ